MLSTGRTANSANAKRSRGRPTREDAKLIEEHLLQVATQVFMEEGYGAATMDGVAAAAGVGKHTLYSRYSGKKALFNAVVERLVRGHMLADFTDDDNVPVFEGLRDRVVAIVHATITIPESLALYRIRLREMTQFPELSDITAQGARAHFIDDLEAYLASKVKSGELPPRDIGFMVKMLLPLIYCQLMEAVVLQQPLPDKAATHRHATRVIDFFLHGWMGSRG